MMFDPIRLTRTMALLAAACAPAVAQSVTATATALTQVVVQAGSGLGTSIFDARPAGTDLTAGLTLHALAANEAGASFGVSTSGGAITYTIDEWMLLGAPYPTSVGSHETLLILSSPQPVVGLLTATYTTSGMVFVAPTAAIDVGNDGAVDWAPAAVAGPQTWQQVVTVAGTLDIRTVTAVSSPFFHDQNLQIEFTPLVESVGVGCVSGFASYYEQMSPSAMDLAGRELVLDDYGGGFLVSSRPGAIQPIGSVGTPIPGPTGDDSALVLGTLAMEIHSNCQVAFAAGNSTHWIPSVATLLNGNPATALYAWTDLDPSASGSGQIWYEENGLDYQVTYDGVYQYNTTQPVTVQFRGNRGYNDHVIAFGPTLHTTGRDWLIGYSPGGPNLDPGPLDYSARTASNPYVSREPDVQSLSLVAATAPLLGTSFAATTSQIEPGALLHLGVVGFADPALPLGFLGLDPACTLHAAPDIFVGPVLVAGQSSLTWNVANLTGAAVAGLEFFVQAVTMDLSLLSGTTRLSNGLKVTIR